MLVFFKEFQVLFVTQKDLLYSDNTLVPESENGAVKCQHFVERGQISISSWEFSPFLLVTGPGTQRKAGLFVSP